jgi:hypothetical protein
MLMAGGFLVLGLGNALGQVSAELKVKKTHTDAGFFSSFSFLLLLFFGFILAISKLYK